MKPDARAARFESKARTFVLGVAYGFIAGALVVSALVWQFDNPIGTRAAGPSPDAPSSAPAEADAPNLEAEPPAAVSTMGGGAVPPPPSIEPVIGAPASSPRELADRDLLIPVEGVSASDLVRSYDDERSGNRQHEAIDILAPKGTPVKAVEDGVIARLFNSKAGGITIYQFDPSQRFCYYYAHLDRYAPDLEEGDRVRKGQVLGYVGVTGNAPKDTPHLHFAVFRLTDAKRWWEGTPIDPYDILR